jgi:hypothetical protein
MYRRTSAIAIGVAFSRQAQSATPSTMRLTSTPWRFAKANDGLRSADEDAGPSATTAAVFTVCLPRGVWWVAVLSMA